MTSRILILSLICSTLLFASLPSAYSYVAPYEDLSFYLNGEDSFEPDNTIKEVNYEQGSGLASIGEDSDTHNDVQSYDLSDKEEAKNIFADKTGNGKSALSEDFVQEPKEELQDSSESTSDLNSDGLQQADIEVNGDTQTVELQSCSVVRIPVDQTGLDIVVNNVFNAQKVMITDGELTTCIDILSFECPDNANFCDLEELDQEAHIELPSEACGLKFIYLYVLPEDMGGELAIEVAVTPKDGSQCAAINNNGEEEEETLDGPTPNVGQPAKNAQEEEEEEEATNNNDNTENGSSESGPATVEDENKESAANVTISDEEYCGLLDFDTCLPANTDVCASRCMWVNCKVNNSETQTQTSSGCVPLTWNTNQLQQMCDSMEEYHTAAPEDQIIEHPVCEQKPSQAISDNGSHDHIVKIVGLACLGLFLVFMLVVCCYRYQFRKNQRGCFNPPSWCPNCLFPTISQDMHMFLPIGARNSNQDKEMDYTPPVL